jgi:hypothetical protein
VSVFFECLLYFVSFGGMFTLFASIVAFIIWLLKTLWLWATEPETDATKSTRVQLTNLNHLKRAGQ